MKKLFLLFTLGLNLYSNAQGWIGNSTNNSLSSYNSNLQLTPIRVGVGTNTLARTFEVNGTSRIGSLAPNLGSLLDIAGGTNNQVNVTHNNNWGLIIGYSGAQAFAGHPYTGLNAAALINAQNGPLFLGTSNTSRLTILGDGNVGIGTNQPTAQLHTTSNLRFENLLQNDALTRVLVQDGNGNISYRAANTIGVNGNFWSLSGNAGTNPNNNFIGTTDNQRLVFRTNNTEKLTILSTGQIGVGINTPLVQFTNSTLHCGNNAGIGTTVASGLDWNCNGQGYVASFYNSDNTDGERNGVLIKTLHTGAGSKVLTINSGIIGTGNDLLTVLGNGRVGVGTNAPGGQFELSLDQGRKPSTNTWTITSDERLKNIHGAYVKGLNEILKLNPITYHYKNGSGREFSKEVLEQECIGFSAQEVKKIFPESVGIDEDGYLNLNIHAVLIAQVNAIKELNAKVEKQNNAVVENEELKAKIAVMEEKFALLEKTITQLCESGCEGLKKAGEGSGSDGDVLFQSIPNPTDSEALINYSLSREYANAFITLSSQDGRQLKSIKLDSKKGSGSIKLSLGELANGTYIYTLVAGERVIDSKKLQIVK